MNQPCCALERPYYTLDQLSLIAREYAVGRNLPVRFEGGTYTRTSILRNDQMEVVLICFADGQTTSVHDHQGSNCVVRVLRGKILENHFVAGPSGELDHSNSQYLQTGDVSGLDGEQIHQLCNLAPSGTVLLNFYSPPFQI
jgi:cysteine dioxygenase